MYVSNFWIIVDLLDPEPSITFINNSPIVSGRDVEIHFATNYKVSSLECRLDAPDTIQLGDDGFYHDCKGSFVDVEQSSVRIFLNFHRNKL